MITRTHFLSCEIAIWADAKTTMEGTKVPWQDSTKQEYSTVENSLSRDFDGNFCFWRVSDLGLRRLMC